MNTKEINTNYEPVIGLEVHIQLKTKSKMFGRSTNDTWQAEPNTRVDEVDLGLPGALPVPNETAVKWTQQLGHALNCQLARRSKFDRKNYFYPDLPKGYQISQFDQPFCEGGYLDIQMKPSEEPKRIRIRRIHLEEDTGKSMHKNGMTYLDFNKSGLPLVELVTEPDFSNPEECAEFARMVQFAVKTLDISNADMEKGNLRLEANVSVRKKGETELPNYRIELKNINSFKFMRDAVNYEIARQIELLEKGETLEQETRGWNEDEGVSVLQRSKENANDYRYFPEPDIPPLEFSDEYIQTVTDDLPKMPWVVEEEMVKEGIRADFAKIIAYDQDKQLIMEKLISELDNKNDIAKVIVNTVSLDQAHKEIEKIKAKSSEVKVEGAELDAILQQVITENPQPVADYKNGKENSLQFLLGQVMKKTGGKVDVPTVRNQLINLLSN